MRFQFVIFYWLSSDWDKLGDEESELEDDWLLELESSLKLLPELDSLSSLEDSLLVIITWFYGIFATAVCFASFILNRIRSISSSNA